MYLNIMFEMDLNLIYFVLNYNYIFGGTLVDVIHTPPSTA